MGCKPNIPLWRETPIPLLTNHTPSQPTSQSVEIRARITSLTTKSCPGKVLTLFPHNTVRLQVPRNLRESEYFCGGLWVCVAIFADFAEGSFAVAEQVGQRNRDIRQDRPRLAPGVALDHVLVLLKIPVFLQVQTVLDLPVPPSQILKLASPETAMPKRQRRRRAAIPAKSR